MGRPRNATANHTLQLRGGVYYARWWRDGAWHRKSLHTSSEEQAQTALAEFCRTAPVLEEVLQSWSSTRKTTGRGLIAETRVLLRFLELGAEVFVPWGHDHKADLIVVSNAQTRRVQVKSVYVAGKMPTIRASSVGYRDGKPIAQIIQRCQADLVVAFWPQRNCCLAAHVTGQAVYSGESLFRLDDLEQALGAGINGPLAH